MKYLLIAMMIDAGGDASALYPPTWYDDEAACQARGVDFRNAMLDDPQQGAAAVHFDCLGLTQLEIIVMSDMMPYKMPYIPSFRPNSAP